MPRKSHLLRSLVKHFVTRSRGMHRGSGVNLSGGRRRYRRVGGARRRTINPYGGTPSSASNAKSFINRNGKKIAMGVAVVGTAALAAKFGPQVASAVGPVLRQAAARVPIPSFSRPRVALPGAVGARDAARAAYQHLTSQIRAGRATSASPEMASMVASLVPQPTTAPPSPMFAPRHRSASSVGSDVLSPLRTRARSRAGSSVGFAPRWEGEGRRHRKMRGGALRLAGHQGSLGGPVHVGISKMGLTNLPQAY